MAPSTVCKNEKMFIFNLCIFKVLKKKFKKVKKNKKEFWGPTEIWTRIAGFKVQSANHYTMGPFLFKTNLSTLFQLPILGQVFSLINSKKFRKL
jgi:hypothetical protein